MLNAAVNFYTHVGETGTAEEQKKAEAERRAKRGVPYLFIKPTRGAVIGDGDEVVIPHGRDRVDWEVELGIVIGRSAKYVAADKAADYIFGYMVTVDVSDRGGRPPGDSAAAPTGWWARATTPSRRPLLLHPPPPPRRRADMIHSIYELLEYGSSIITLFPATSSTTAPRAAPAWARPTVAPSAS